MSTTGSDKATGWKIPLLFCATVILIVSVVALWRYLSRPEIPTLEPGLLEQARALHIDLEADAWGRSFKNLLVDSAGRLCRARPERRQGGTAGKGSHGIGPFRRRLRGLGTCL